jgi:hypothetical protein
MTFPVMLFYMCFQMAPHILWMLTCIIAFGALLGALFDWIVELFVVSAPLSVRLSFAALR